MGLRGDMESKGDVRVETDDELVNVHNVYTSLLCHATRSTHYTSTSFHSVTHGLDGCLLWLVSWQLTTPGDFLLFALTHVSLLWTPAQRKRASMLYFANVLFIFLWPPYSPALVNGNSRKFYTWCTLNNNNRVSLKKLLLGFFPGHPYTTGWAKKWRNLAYFQTPPANFMLSRPNVAEYCNSEKNC